MTQIVTAEPVRIRRAAPARPSGLLDALHAEWTKLRTVSSTGWLLLTTVVLTVEAAPWPPRW